MIHFGTVPASSPEIVMAAVKQDGNALDFASKSLQINREVVMAAVKQDGTERVLEIEGSLIIVNSEMVNLIKYQEATKLQFVVRAPPHPVEALW